MDRRNQIDHRCVECGQDNSPWGFFNPRRPKGELPVFKFYCTRHVNLGRARFERETGTKLPELVIPGAAPIDPFADAPEEKTAKASEGQGYLFHELVGE